MTRLAIVFGLFAAACGGGKSDETPPAASGSQVATGSAPAKPAGSSTGSAAGSAASKGSAAGSGSGSATVAVAPKDPDVPTAEDFDQEATTRITEKNLETEVKALEKEIGDN